MEILARQHRQILWLQKFWAAALLEKRLAE
jgi:hypothetical protein